MDDHDHSEVRALRGVGAVLAGRGLKVTETTTPEGLPELAVTNPARPSRGRMYVGPEGYLIWECWAPAAATSASGEIVSAVIAALGNVEPGSPGRESRH